MYIDTNMKHIETIETERSLTKLQLWFNKGRRGGGQTIFVDLDNSKFLIHKNFQFCIVTIDISNLDYLI